jgi:hypothetical protein
MQINDTTVTIQIHYAFNNTMEDIMSKRKEPFDFERFAAEINQPNLVFAINKARNEPDPEKALAYLSQAEKAFNSLPEDSQNNPKNKELAITGYGMAARNYLMLGDDENARKQFNKMIKLDDIRFQQFQNSHPEGQQGGTNYVRYKMAEAYLELLDKGIPNPDLPNNLLNKAAKEYLKAGYEPGALVVFMEVSELEGDGKLSDAYLKMTNAYKQLATEEPHNEIFYTTKAEAAIVARPTQITKERTEGQAQRPNNVNHNGNAQPNLNNNQQPQNRGQQINNNHQAEKLARRAQLNNEAIAKAQPQNNARQQPRNNDNSHNIRPNAENRQSNNSSQGRGGR